MVVRSDMFAIRSLIKEADEEAIDNLLMLIGMFVLTMEVIFLDVV